MGADGDDSLDAKLTTHKEDTKDQIDREAEARRADINNEAATRESEIQNARDAASARSDQVEADSKDRDTALQNAVDSAAGEKSGSQVVYKSGTEGNSAEETITGTLPGLIPGKTYSIDVDVLRNDLGDPSEYVKSINVGGHNM